MSQSAQATSATSGTAAIALELVETDAAPTSQPIATAAPAQPNHDGRKLVRSTTTDVAATNTAAAKLTYPNTAEATMNAPADWSRWSAPTAVMALPTIARATRTTPAMRAIWLTRPAPPSARRSRPNRVPRNHRNGISASPPR